MGLPVNLSGVLRLNFERFWGAAAPMPRLALAELSVASSPAAVAPPLRSAAADASAASPQASLSRLWAAVQNTAAAVLLGMQLSRMRQAQRHIAEYRSRLPRPEGSLQ